MSHHFSSRLGAQLYRLLPELYVTRDKVHNARGVLEHPLADYLDAHGLLLDRIHGTIEQLLRDAMPGTSQEWLVPYFARLVATTVLSPDLEGKHAEIANAVGWRQRKGTLKCAESIAEAVGRMEVEIHEGWTRVALTPHVGRPLLPLAAVDSACDQEPGLPGEIARHPALPASMIDFRRPARAIGADAANPAARSSTFNGIIKTWRHANVHGAPCFPGSYEDVSRRTVDIRTPDDPNGCYHHKRVLLFTPPPDGFFATKALLDWNRLDAVAYKALIEQRDEAGQWVIRNRTERIIEVATNVTLEARHIRIEGIRFLGTLTVPSGGRLALAGVEVNRVEVGAALDDETVLSAADCLFDEVYVPQGRVDLDSCTVLGNATLDSVWATDTIFMEISGDKITGDLQYCRIPESAFARFDWKNTSCNSHQADQNPVSLAPSFFPGQTKLSGRAVLFPNAPEAILRGAGDGGEMGYFHHGRRAPVRIEGKITLTLPLEGATPLEDLVFEGQVTLAAGPLVLHRTAIPDLRITGVPIDRHAPSLSARDSLFQSITAEKHLVRLEYCTVMENTSCKYLQASDCLFVGGLTLIEDKGDLIGDPPAHCLRYSSVPSSVRHSYAAEALKLTGSGGGWTLRTNTIDRPTFGAFRVCGEAGRSDELPDYLERGYGVLDSHSPRTLRFGAEDGGEIGAYHHKQYALKAEAMLAKIREFLPVGIEPVLIEDQRLLYTPPDQSST